MTTVLAVPRAACRHRVVTVAMIAMLAVLMLAPARGGAADALPTTPTGLIATPYGSHAGEVSWRRSTDDVLVYGYEITRDGQVLGTRDALSVVSVDLAPATTYRYGITAIDSIGQRSGTAFIDLTTTASVSGTALAAPAGLRASVYSTTAAELFWLRASVSGLRYEISRDGVIVATTDGTSYFTAALSAGTAYTFSVVAIDTKGVRSSAASVSLTTRGEPLANAPQAPSGLRADVYSSTAAELFWTRPAVSGLRYEISRDDTLVAMTDGISFFDDTLQAGTSYTYAVVAVDPAGRRSSASSVSLTTIGGGAVVPPADGNPYAEPDPDGTTVIARLGYAAARDLADDLVSAAYLERYYDIHPALYALARTGPLGELATHDCPGGGTAVGKAGFFDFGLVVDHCVIEDTTLDGAVSFVVEFVVLGAGDAQNSTLVFTDLSVDAGAAGSVVLTGTSERHDSSLALTTALCSAAPTIVRQTKNRIDSALWVRDGTAMNITNAEWTQTSTTYPAPVDNLPPCATVATLSADGSATVTATLFGGDSEPAALDKAVDIVRDPRNDPAYSGTAMIATDFGDGSTLSLTASTTTDGEVQVDIVDGSAVVSFVDDYRFEARTEVPPVRSE